MDRTVQFHREALIHLLQSPGTDGWIVAPSIRADAVGVLLPYLRRDGLRLRVLTHLTPGLLAEGKVDLEALQMLRGLGNCEIRSLQDLSACIYAMGPTGPALVTGAPLTLEGLDSDRTCGVMIADGTVVLADLNRWWNLASPLDEPGWVELALQTSYRLESRSLADEIARLGAFVRVSVRGTRRTRRLDPKEFGAAEAHWGRAVRPVEVALYKLDEVIRAKEDLEATLAEHGVEWNGYYLVPRHFLERDWPRLFAARERQLRDRLRSTEGKATLKAQLSEARRDLEAFFGEIYARTPTDGMPAPMWVDMQTTRVLTETVSDTILKDSGLDYRVLTILPEDTRSREELHQLLQDPKLKSIQLTFHF